MSENIAGRSLLIVIYPYKFTNFVYDLMELDYYKNQSDVKIYDISEIVTRRFSNAISADRSDRNNVIVLYSVFDFLKILLELRDNAKTKRIYIINVLMNSRLSTMLEFICASMLSLIFWKTNISIIDLYNGGVPGEYFTNSLESIIGARKKTFSAKVINAVKTSSTPTEFARRARAFAYIQLAKLLPKTITHRIVAGDDWIKLAIRDHSGKRKDCRFIYANSFDYSRVLRESNVITPRNLKTAVLLDGAGPAFSSDAVQMGQKVYFTSDIWYPALCRFFEEIEATTGVRVAIAAHYKTAFQFKEPLFGNRNVFYGKTLELVRNSEFVITRNSTAISYAVAFKKPIIFIYNNQLALDLQSMLEIRGMAACTGGAILNIDDPVKNFASLLRIDETRHAMYRDACLTSDLTHRPNYKIVLSEIMGVRTV